MLLAGKVTVIFGGSGAIGSAVAHTMAREGAMCIWARAVRKSWIGPPAASERRVAQSKLLLPMFSTNTTHQNKLLALSSKPVE